MMRNRIFDIAIDNVTLKEITAWVRRAFEEGHQKVILYANAETLLAASRDEALRRAFHQADLVFPDGSGLKLIGWLRGAPFKERIAGIDVLLRICERAAALHKSVFLLGGGNGVAHQASEILKKKFPQLKFAGWMDGFGELERWRHNEAIFHADVLFVGLGTPKQEEWIIGHSGVLSNLKIIMAVGGALDMIAGVTPRAPRILRRLGLEWFWRFIFEPVKRFKRMVNAVCVFPVKALWRR